MTRTGELQSTTHTGAMQYSNHRHCSKLHFIQHTVPHTAMVQAFDRICFNKIRKVKPSAEMLAVATQNSTFNALRNGGKYLFYRKNYFIVDRIAFLCTA